MVIPFFHSLQYLPFAAMFRKNKVNAQLTGITGVPYRAKFVFSFWGYIVLSVVIGGLVFYAIPFGIDQVRTAGILPTPPMLVMAFFTVFLNIHHYFIDSVIWRKNSETTKYLLSSKES